MAGVRIVSHSWETTLREGLPSSRVRIASPFIKDGAVQSLFGSNHPESLQVLTRFNLDHFEEGVSDLAALRRLLGLGAKVRGVKRLHLKVYVFDDTRAVITSANLTQAGLAKNHELGVVAEGGEIPRRCSDHFDELWEQAGPDLTKARLDDWEQRIEERQAAAVPSHGAALGDEGVDLSGESELQFPPWFDEPTQAFVKFFGTNENRAPRNYLILEELRRGGAHWACTYPKNKRPRSVQDGAVMFMGRLVHSPNDTMIYGRAVGLHYEEGRDDASSADLARRPWKKDWPHYVRVHHGEFLRGPVENGVPLSELMDELGPYAFGSTAEHAEAGTGNLDPRKAIQQAAAVRLAPTGVTWLSERLEFAFGEHGKLQPTELAALDWPGVATSAVPRL